jgi:hypothetical protein
MGSRVDGREMRDRKKRWRVDVWKAMKRDRGSEIQHSLEPGTMHNVTFILYLIKVLR